MSTLVIDVESVRADSVEVNDEALIVNLSEGRSVSVPLAWYPRLWYGTGDERARFEIIGDGMYIHWPDLDEDLSVVGILAGRRSGESQQSLKRWLATRAG
jgi:hypothetical protein